MLCVSNSIHFKLTIGIFYLDCLVFKWSVGTDTLSVAIPQIVKKQFLNTLFH